MSSDRLQSLLQGEIADRLKATNPGGLEEGLLKKLWAANSDVGQGGSSDPCKLIKLNSDFLTAISDASTGNKP